MCQTIPTASEKRAGEARQRKAPRKRLEGEETQHRTAPTPLLSFLVFVAVSMVKTGWQKALLPVTFFFNGNE